MLLFSILLILAFILLSVAVNVTVFIVKVALFGLVGAFVVGAILSALRLLTERQP